MDGKRIFCIAGLHLHVGQVAGLHLTDVDDGILPSLRSDAHIAPERVLQLEQQHHRGDHDGDDRGRHRHMDSLVLQSEKPAEADDADTADQQHDPLEPVDAVAIDADALLPAVVNDRELLGGLSGAVLARE